MNTGETENGERFWKEWDAFCDSLIEGIKRFDSRKNSQNFHTPALSPGDNLDKELDLYLRLSLPPPANGLPDGLFAETPPHLEKALRGRIANAKVFLTKFLEREVYQNIQSQDDLVKAASLSFRDFLLPSSPNPGEYTVQ
jgi:hypothetical protein